MIATNPTAPRLSSGVDSIPQWLRVTRLLVRNQAVVAMWVIVSVVALDVIVLTIASQFVQPTMSGIQFAVQFLMWLAFGMSINTVVSYARALIAAGATRHSVITAGLLTAVIAGAGYALVATALLAVEGAVYHSLGWTHDIRDNAIDFAASYAVPQQIWGSFVSVTLMGVSGLLVGATYLRFRAWATFLLPLTVILPVAALSLSTVTPQTISIGGESPSTILFGVAGPLVGSILQILLVVALAVSLWFTLRRVPIRQPAS